jgi:hypothetical protein
MRIGIYNNEFIYFESSQYYIFESFLFNRNNNNLLNIHSETILYYFKIFSEYEDFYLTDLYYFFTKKVFSLKFDVYFEDFKAGFLFDYLNKNILNKELLSVLINNYPKLVFKIKHNQVYRYYSLLKEAFIKDNTIIKHYRFKHLPKKYKIRLYKEFKNILDNKEFKEFLYDRYYFNIKTTHNFKQIILT